MKATHVYVGRCPRCRMTYAACSDTPDVPPDLIAEFKQDIRDRGDLLELIPFDQYQQEPLGRCEHIEARVREADKAAEASKWQGTICEPWAREE